jgi:CheY-like chemotaxis protein
MARFHRNSSNGEELMTKSTRTFDGPAAELPLLQGLRVLVVEDSASVGDAIANLLRSLGAEVLGPAATSTDAVRLIEQVTPDVALVDMSLRGGELAYDLIDRLHVLGIRIVVMSGYDAVPGVDGKAAAVLEKPVSESSLLASLAPVTTAGDTRSK